MIISEEKNLQLRLDAAEASITRLLNHLPGTAYRCTVSKDGYTMVFVSNGSTAMLGLTSEYIMNDPVNTIERMMLPEHLAKVRNTINDSIKKKKSYELYYAVQLESDEIKWIWDQGEGVYDSDGKCIFLEGIMMDITGQKEREVLLKQENRQLRSSIGERQVIDKIAGNSPPMQQVYSLMRKAADSDTNVIIYGETGVGKDLIAKTIHKLSAQKGTYIPVNCAAIPEQLLESEFFGHVKGAFSGATANRAGYLAAADNGTLFLDEIGELPLHLQVKLLRSLESKTYTPIGSSDVRRSSFRLVSATNRNLKEMVMTGMMRADFFYRINVLTISLPPLRERLEDLPALIEMYAKNKKKDENIPKHILSLFKRYSWPGNVRELQNVLERFWTFGEERLVHYFTDTNQEHLPITLAPWTTTSPTLNYPANPFNNHNIQQPAQQNNIPLPQPVNLASTAQEAERQQILHMLEMNGWRKGKTAEALGISLRTLQRRLQKYAIAR